MTYTHSVTLPLPYDKAVEATKEALGNNGFGVLTEIDMNATFAKKLGQEAADQVGRYVILGACNPQLASKAVQSEPEIGAFLPCNVVVRALSQDSAEVFSIDPMEMMQLSDSPQVSEVARDADQRLKATLQELESEQ